jgi:hypothetical protein
VKEQALDEIPHHPGLAVFTAPKVTKREGKWGKDKIIVAGEMWSIPDSDPYGVFRSLRGGVGLAFTCQLGSQTPSDPLATSIIGDRFFFVAVLRK